MIGKKCYLAPIDVNDVEKYTEWLNDLEVTKHLILYPHVISIENEKVILEKLSLEHTYSIIDNDTNELIGNCGLGSIDHLNQTAETGIFIGNRKFWDKGYGTEALSLLLDYGFKALNLHNISLSVQPLRRKSKGNAFYIRKRKFSLDSIKGDPILCNDICNKQIMAVLFSDNKRFAFR